MREGRNTGIQKGLEEGLEKGKWQKSRLFVFRADRIGMSVADIAELVDLPEEAVEALACNLTMLKFREGRVVAQVFSFINQLNIKL